MHSCYRLLAHRKYTELSVSTKHKEVFMKRRRNAHQLHLSDFASGDVLDGNVQAVLPPLTGVHSPETPFSQHLQDHKIKIKIIRC